MFDIFPYEDNNIKDIPSELTSLINTLKIKIKHDFAEYKETKNSLLQSIGFLSKKSVKDRILQRSQLISDRFGEHRLKNLDLVIHHGVKCRNYFVHGTKDKKVPPKEYLNLQSFFIRTFEFIYIVSELIECGWNPSDDGVLTSHHKIRFYEEEYKLNLKKLEDVISLNSG